MNRELRSEADVARTACGARGRLEAENRGGQIAIAEGKRAGQHGEGLFVDDGEGVLLPDGGPASGQGAYLLGGGPAVFRPGA